MPDPTPITLKLSSLRRSARSRFLLGALARLSVLAASILAALVALDWLVRAERPVRLIFAAIAAAALALLCRKLFSPLVQPMTDEDLALAVEAKHPELQDRLISAVQLFRKAPSPFNAPLLVEKTLKEALAACEAIPFHQALPMPRQGRWLGSALLAVGTFGFLAYSSESFRTGLMRLVLDRPWPSAYALQIEIPGERFPQGEDFPVAARLMPGSKTPRRVVAHLRLAGGEEREMTLGVQDGVYRGTVERLNRDLTLWVTAGDFRSAEYRVKVLEKPVVATFQVKVRPPDYTGLPEKALPANTGHLRALRGAHVHVEGTSSKPLKACGLRFQKKTAALTLSDPTRFSGDFLVEEEDSYVFTLEDLEDLKAAHPVTYQVTVMKDQAPTVRIPKPGKDLEVIPTAKVPIHVEAQDDYGLGAGTLLTVLNRGTPQEKEERLPLFAAPASKDQRSMKAQHVWDLGPLKLEPGRQLRYRAEAADLDTISGPNVGRSQEYGISVISKEDFEARVQGVLEALKSDLERSKDAARRVRTGIEALPAAPSKEASAASLALDEGRLSEGLRQTQDALGTLQDMIAMNAAGDPRRDEILQSARDSLKSLVQKKVPAVQEDLKAAGRGDEAAREQALSGQEGVLQEIDRIGRAFEGAASFGELLKRLQRLIEQSDRLARGAGGTR